MSFSHGSMGEYVHENAAPCDLLVLTFGVLVFEVWIFLFF